MKPLNRDDIRILRTHLVLREQDIDRVLKEHINSDQSSWRKFLRIFLISLGIGFSVAGIIFFFAYNWADLHKFVKLAIAEGLMIGTCSLVLFLKVKSTVRNILLTAAAVLVGVMFAVYGQIYQTGANAYDFFLGWTLFATLWVIVSGFPPLWLIYLALIQTTLVLYEEQVARHWTELTVPALLFGINAAALAISNSLKMNGKVEIPNWFHYVLGLAAASIATLGIITGIFNGHDPAFMILLLLTALVYALGIFHSLQSRSIFYLAVIAFSLIMIGSALLIKISDGEAMLLLVSLFIIGSVTLVIRQLLDFQKKWSHAN